MKLAFKSGLKIYKSRLIITHMACLWTHFSSIIFYLLLLLLSPFSFSKLHGFLYSSACGQVDVGTCPHQVFAATLTLSQPVGADYAHPILVSTPSFESHRRACYSIASLMIRSDRKQEPFILCRSSQFQQILNNYVEISIMNLCRNQRPTRYYYTTAH